MRQQIYNSRAMALLLLRANEDFIILVFVALWMPFISFLYAP